MPYYRIQVADRRAPPHGRREKPTAFNSADTNSDYAEELRFIWFRGFESKRHCATDWYVTPFPWTQIASDDLKHVFSRVVSRTISDFWKSACECTTRINSTRLFFRRSCRRLGIYIYLYCGRTSPGICTPCRYSYNGNVISFLHIVYIRYTKQ